MPTAPTAIEGIPARRSSSRLLTALLMLLLAQTAWWVVRSAVDLGAARLLVAGAVTLATPLVAAALASTIWRRNELDVRDRRGWLLLSCACAFSALFTTLTVVPIAVGYPIQIFDNLAAGSHYIMVVLLAIAMSQWIRGLSAAASLSTMLDLICVGLIGYLTMSSTSVVDAFDPSNSTGLDSINAMLWPIFDVLLLLMVVTVLSQVGRQRIRGPEILTALGVALVAISDLYLTYTGVLHGDLQQAFVDAIAAPTTRGADIGWFLGFLAIAVAAFRRRQLPQDDQVPVIERSALWESIWALVPFVALTVTLVIELQNPIEGANKRIAFLSLIGLLIARCGLVVLAALRMGRSSHYDALTGALNHRQLQERLPFAVEIALSKSEPLSLIMIDVDDFGMLNESYGHSEGDRFLQEMAWTVRFMLGDRHQLYRNGGDEFAILAPGLDAEGAHELAVDLCKHVAELELLGGAPPQLTMGIATVPDNTSDPHELVQLASGTLYWGKLNGKASVTSYDPEVVKVLNVEDRVQVMERNARLRAVLALARALDARDTYTARHSQNVARYSVAIASQLGWNPEQQELLRIAGLLHDVGKIGVRDSVLTKQSGLTDEEWEEMRQHPTLGARVISDVAPPQIIEWVLAHHERIDGRGYPFGLMGDEIPLGARILAVADTFDAMTSSRAYRPGMPVLWGLNELVAGTSEQFDPDVVRAFIRAVRSGDLWLEIDESGRVHAPSAPAADPEFAADIGPHAPTQTPSDDADDSLAA